MGEALRLADETTGYDYYTVDLWTEVPGVGAEISFDRMTDGDNGAIWCEMSVFIMANSRKTRIITPSRTNLMNATKASAGWRSHLETLNQMAGALRWEEILTHVVGRAIEVFRDGAVASPLSVASQGSLIPWLLEPFVSGSGVSVLFGEGGVGKSFIGLAAALSIASSQTVMGLWAHQKGPVIYFDYEDDDHIHNERLTALARGHGIDDLDHPILHYSLVARVSSAQAQMRRIVREHSAVFAVLDSIGMGRGGDASTAEDTIRLFRALRSLGIPVLALDHVTKEDKRSGRNLTPYGSIYTVNTGRLLWGAQMLPISTPMTRYVHLENTKANHVPRQDPNGLKLTFSNDDRDILRSVRITPADAWWDELDEEGLQALREIRGLTEVEEVKDE